MQFEFDPIKNQENFEKHKIDFVEAQKIWEGEIVQFPSKYEAEARQVVIGMIEEIHWTAIITMRGDIIRFISVRRSRDNEKQIHEQNHG